MPAAARHTRFLEIDIVLEVCYVCPPRLIITSGAMWGDMDLTQPAKQALQLSVVAIVGVNSGRGPRTVVRHRNQPIESKPALYKPLLHFRSNLKTAAHKQQGGVLQSQKWVWHVLAHTYQGIQKKRWLGLQINVPGLLLVICDRIREEMRTTHTPNFAHLDIHKITGNCIQT